MGIQYTNDNELGDYIVGNSTGSRYNHMSSLGADHAMDHSNSTGVSSRVDSNYNRSYTMLPIFENFLDNIPAWFYWIVTIVGAIAGLVIALQTTSASLSVNIIFSLGGAGIGAVFLP